MTDVKVHAVPEGKIEKLSIEKKGKILLFSFKVPLFFLVYH